MVSNVHDVATVVSTVYNEGASAISALFRRQIQLFHHKESPMTEYVHPEYLVDTDWVAAHLNDPSVRIAESDEDYLLYETGHIPGAVKVDWFTILQDPVRRDFLSKESFEKLCSSLGIGNDTT